MASFGRSSFLGLENNRLELLECASSLRVARPVSSCVMRRALARVSRLRAHYVSHAVVPCPGRNVPFRKLELAGDRKVKLKRLRGRSDEFELEDEVDFALDRPELGEDEEEDMRDYETEYESVMGYTPAQGESETFVNTENEEEETVVDWKINEDEFHKLSLFTCDFFIRKVSDPDDDVYDFREVRKEPGYGVTSEIRKHCYERESTTLCRDGHDRSSGGQRMYVTPPDTDTYSIPKVVGTMPKKPIRCTASRYEYIHTTEPPVDQPRAPMYKTDMECMKIFLMRHLKDRHSDHEKFILDFNEIYVIDSKSKSITRAEVTVEAPGGKDRDRSREVLIVRDDGTTFKIIPEEEQKNPDEVIGAMQWERTREAMENYLRGFRDYETSNWF